MDVRLYSNQKVRIKTGHKENNFIDVESGKDELVLTTEFYPSFHYIEIREKNNFMKTFLFEKKGHKKHYDFGFWEDAKVIFSKNDVLNPENK